MSTAVTLCDFVHWMSSSISSRACLPISESRIAANIINCLVNMEAKRSHRSVERWNRLKLVSRRGLMNHRINNRLLPLLIVAAVLFAQAGCSSSPSESSNSSGAVEKPNSQAGPENANAPASANTSEPAATSQQPAGAGTLPASSTPSPAGPPPTSTPSTAASVAAQTAVAPQPPPPARTYTLASGRGISVFTTSTLSTKSNKTGEPFTATLASPIVDGDWVVAHKGAAVAGVIVNSDPGGRIKGVASLAVKLNRLTLADGRTIPIATSAYVTQAKTTKKKDARKIGIGAGAGALIGALAGGGKGAAIGAGVGGGAGTAALLATRGDPAVIPGESQVSFRLATPVKIIKR
jgi:hypothetical protein